MRLLHKQQTCTKVIRAIQTSDARRHTSVFGFQPIQSQPVQQSHVFDLPARTLQIRWSLHPPCPTTMTMMRRKMTRLSNRPIADQEEPADHPYPIDHLPPLIALW